MVYKKMQNKTAKLWSWKTTVTDKLSKAKVRKKLLHHKQTDKRCEEGRGWQMYTGWNKYTGWHMYRQQCDTCSCSCIPKLLRQPLQQVHTLPTYLAPTYPCHKFLLFLIFCTACPGHKIMHKIIHTALPDQSIKSILLWQVCVICSNIYSRQYPNATEKHSCWCIYDKRHVHSKHTRRPCTWARHRFM